MMMREMAERGNSTMAPGDSTASDNGIVRRVMLKRGLVATVGIGLSSLLGPAAARAATASTITLPSDGSFVSTPGIVDTTDCDACITCNIDEFQCPPPNGSCGTGQCCYLCSGCGYGPYTRCYNHTCNILKFKTCPGS
jgi:hypothetical protein